MISWYGRQLEKKEEEGKREKKGKRGKERKKEKKRERKGKRERQERDCKYPTQIYYKKILYIHQLYTTILAS